MKNNDISIKTITLYPASCQISGQIDGFAAFPEKHPRFCSKFNPHTQLHSILPTSDIRQSQIEDVK